MEKSVWTFTETECAHTATVYLMRTFVFFEPELEYFDAPLTEEIADVRTLLNLVLVGNAYSKRSCDMLFRIDISFKVKG